MLVGLSLVMASACVFNNYLDRGLDRHMDRTRSRALVTGEVSGLAGVSFAVVLGLCGAGVLWALTNPLTLGIAAFGFLAYVVLYGFAKRHSVHGTVVGSLSGAVPPVVGYVAVTGQIDLTAWLLFGILTVWQMPHFYAIAMFRYQDYQAAGLPVLPVSRGKRETKVQMLAYIVAFIPMTLLLAYIGSAGVVYAAVMLLLGAWWVRLAVAGFSAADDTAWARRVFKFSLLILLVFSALIAASSVLP